MGSVGNDGFHVSHGQSAWANREHNYSDGYSTKQYKKLSKN